MVSEYGAVDAARRLLDVSSPAEGFTRLHELGRLDLSVEAMALRPEFEPLFTTRQRRAAKLRLDLLGYEGEAEHAAD
jgi:hypothetical protein